MKMLAEVVATSVLQDPTKHAAGMTIVSAGVVNGNEHDFAIFPQWIPLGDMAVVIGIIVGVFTIIKTYNEIKLVRMKLKKEEE
tara:strand:- start:25 stop:273 length:249 start_codon:yes stop_codon:yes gene_type:complete